MSYTILANEYGNFNVYFGEGLFDWFVVDAATTIEEINYLVEDRRKSNALVKSYKHEN